MADRREPAVYTIPPHRAFADALVTGLLSLHGADRMALARGIILVPNNRAGQAISDAFVRRAEGGEEVEEAVGVFEARGLAPVGREDVVLHGLTVEWAKRETINARDDAVFFLQPMTEGRQRRWLGELSRSTVAEAQSEDIRLTRRDAVTHTHSVVA